jgi:hypothetical protein
MPVCLATLLQPAATIICLFDTLLLKGYRYFVVLDASRQPKSEGSCNFHPPRKSFESSHLVALNPRRQKAKQPRPTINHTFRDSVLFFSHQYYNRPQSTDEIVIEVAQWRFKIVLSNEEEQTIKMKEAVRRRRKS